MPVIQLENVEFSYDKQHKVIDNLSLSVNEGEFVAVIGHNGSGKSTLAKLLNALLIPDKGSVIVDGLSSSVKDNLFEIRKRVGVVFQNPDNQLVASIVIDDVAFGPENLGLSREEIKSRIDYALNSTGTTEFKNASPEKLSGGQKQRVAIAGVLALKPKVLVLDESTAMLDPVGRREIIEVAKKLNREEHVTVILITHYMEEVVFADKVFVLKNGAIALTGSPKQVFKDKTRIKELGLELPTATYIAEKLRENGVPVPEVFTDSEIKEALCKS